MLGLSPGSFLVCLCLFLTAGCSRHPAKENGVVELSVLMDADVAGDWHQFIREFEAANPGVHINYIEGPSETNAREDLYVTSLLSGQTVYDLIFADVVWVPKFAAAGWLEDLTDRWPAERWNEFIPAALEGGKYKGRIYRVPQHIDVGMLFYRRDLLEAANEKPPETFDELVRIAQKFQRPPQLWGYVWQGKQYEGLVCDFMEVLTGFGGFWINSDTGEVGLDHLEAVHALEWMRDAIHRVGISPPGTTAYTEEEGRLMFQSGRALFHRNWPFVLVTSQQEGSVVRGKVGIKPMPATRNGRSAATLGGWGMCIAKNSRHKDVAWKFCEYISALPQVERIQAHRGSPPALKAYYEQSDDPARKDLYAVMQTTVVRPRIPQYAQASDILQRYVSAALTERMASADALAAAARETRLLLPKPATPSPGALRASSSPPGRGMR
jgi:multiple sugar transport system substrate-binding protein